MKLRILLISALVLLVAGISASDVLAATAPKADAPLSAPDAAWTVRCNKDEKDAGPKRGRCEIFQRLIVKDTKQRVAEMAIGFPREKNNARGIVIVPLGILLQPGIQLTIDSGKPFKFQVRYCDVAGCFGFLDLNDEILNTMKKAQKLTLTFQSLQKKTINIELNLKDFDKALQEIS